MIQKMKRKLCIRFVVFSMLALILMQGLIVAFSAYHSYTDMVQKADLILQQIRKTPSENTRYFSVSVNPGQHVMRITDRKNVSVREDDAAKLAKLALEKGEEKGFAEGYRYQILKKDGKMKIWFLSRTASLEMHKNAVLSLIQVSLAGLSFALLFLILISGKIVDPLIKSHQKQKEFITSASHELKTPLAVMLADIQLLETETGENPWIRDVEKQIRHMTEMTQSMISLARAEETNPKETFQTLSLSDLAREVTDSYKSLALQKQKELNLEITKDLSYFGNKKSLGQLFSILLDNAFKYSPEGEEIRIRLAPYHRGALFSVTNKAQGLLPQELPSFSERFFRGNTKKKTEGFGLGLSIARAIAESHKGSLSVTSPEPNVITITAYLK